MQNLQKENPNPIGQKSQPSSASKSSKRISLQAHEQISNIFKLISDKETGRDGIQQLFEFKQKNPDVDIEHFLQGSNPIFRKFIDDGLAELENAATKSDENKISPEKRFDSDYWMDRLNTISEKWYAMDKPSRDDERNDNRSSSENLNVNFTSRASMAQKEVSIEREFVFFIQKLMNFIPFQTNEPISSNRLDLMKRLAQIRSQK